MQSALGGFGQKRGQIEYTNPISPGVKGKVFALGVWFTTDKRNASFQKRRKDSVKVKINVIELSQLWRFTLLGKITLIKSLLVSQLIYAEADLWEFRRWLSFTKIFRCVQFTAYVPSQLSKGFYPDVDEADYVVFAK